MKVAILGQGPRSLAVPDDHEVWVINGPNMPARWDRLYQLHSLEHLREVHGEQFLTWLRGIEAPRRLVMVNRHREIPHAEGYPWAVALHWAAGRPYFTHSTPLLIAQAVAEGATELLLDGFSDRPGLEHEKHCVAFHLGAAARSGVSVTVTPAYRLLPGPTAVYGLQEAQWIAERQEMRP